MGMDNFYTYSSASPFFDPYSKPKDWLTDRETHDELKNNKYYQIGYKLATGSDIVPVGKIDSFDA